LAKTNFRDILMSKHKYLEKQVVTSLAIARRNFGIWIAMYVERLTTLFKKLKGLRNGI
tara:strand:- start:167 stop:340 length:174 start_codon:yes stop_codon:yes gene_type:complete